MSLLSRAVGSITKASDQPPTGPSNPGNRRQSGGGQGGNRASPYARPSGDSWKHDKFAESNSSTPSTAPSSKSAGGSLAARLSGNGTSSVGQGQQRSNKLVIKDLHYEVSERELEALFIQVGPLASGPKIKFDKSGRSTGLAWVSYASEDHAAAAKQAFDGCPAKGQNIKVEYDYRTERTVPTPGSLLARLDADPNAPRGPRNGPSVRGGRPHVGPQRGVGSAIDSRPPRGAPAGPRRGGIERGVGGGGGGRGGGREAKREPKTNDDLDKELEAFMKTPAAEEGEKATPSTTTTTTNETAPAPQAESGGDVEMS